MDRTQKNRKWRLCVVKDLLYKKTFCARKNEVKSLLFEDTEKIRMDEKGDGLFRSRESGMA
jgi:hypothetical protein